MGALSNAAQLATDPDFRDVCLAALLYQSRVVITEDPGTEFHEQRVMYARAIMQNPESYRDTVSWVVSTDPAIAVQGSAPSAVSEDDVLASVDAAWNYLAGFAQDGEVTPVG